MSSSSVVDESAKLVNYHHREGWYGQMASERLENEMRFEKFYHSLEPETTPNYPFQDYRHPVKRKYDSATGELGLYLQQAVTDPGRMLLVENTKLSCACLRDCFRHTGERPTNAPTTMLSSQLERIPPEAHQHLAHKLATLVFQLEHANPGDMLDIRSLDARRHPRAVIPGNLQGAMNLDSSNEKRGPWSEVEAGMQKTLDYERVWNIVANNAVCYKVRSRTQGEPSQEETCEFWGMWITPSFINHSCTPNCHGMRVGDAIIIRAAKPIAAGEELTLPYFDIFQPLCKRELAAQKWGFRCECARCTFERSIGKPYNAIQEEVVNLERQIEKSWSLKDAKIRAVVSEVLMNKLRLQTHPAIDLEKKIALNSLKETNEHDVDMPFVEPHQLVERFHWIRASFIEPYAAYVALGRQFISTASVNRLFLDANSRLDMAEKLHYLIKATSTILEFLTSIHPGNLLGQEFHSMLLETTRALFDYDLDQNLTANRASRDLYIKDANQFFCAYYGPLIKPLNV